MLAPTTSFCPLRSQPHATSATANAVSLEKAGADRATSQSGVPPHCPPIQPATFRRCRRRRSAAPGLSRGQWQGRRRMKRMMRPEGLGLRGWDVHIRLIIGFAILIHLARRIWLSKSTALFINFRADYDLNLAQALSQSYQNGPTCAPQSKPNTWLTAARVS